MFKGVSWIIKPEDLDGLWAKVRQGEEWKRRFGKGADEVMVALRSR
ncbi:MAG: hypothetical protein U9N43_02995 [Euryarchaeota archaeon]|nr:hypothetical protein [Euryarchaeota archaeon]